MKRSLLFVSIFIGLALMGTACSPDMQSAIQTGVAMTQQISELQTAAAGGGKQAEPNDAAQEADGGQDNQADNNSAPQEDPPTATNTPMPSNTPIGPAMFTVGQDTNCRYGASASNFDIRRTIFNGQSVPIVGQGANPAEEWWVVEVDGVQCWVWRELGQASGDFQNVQRINPPATPTPSKTPKPTATDPPASSNVTFYIKNNHAVAICYAFISNVIYGTWGGDELGADTIPPGGTYYFTVAAADYDFKLEDCGNNVLDTAFNVTIDQNTVGFTSP